MNARKSLMIKITEEVYWTHVEPLDLSFIQVSFFPQWFYIYLAQAVLHLSDGWENS